MDDPLSTFIVFVLCGASFGFGHILGKVSIYSDCQTVGVFYTASKVYECKERK